MYSGVNLTGVIAEEHQKLLARCLAFQNSEKELSELKVDFFDFSKDLHKRMLEFTHKVRKVPFTAWIISWTEFVHYDQMFGARYVKMMNELIERNFILLASDKNTPILSQDLAIGSRSEVIDSIRCCLDWSISKKEEFVLFYTNFALWLSKQTFGFIPEAMDIDRNITRKRKLPFDVYIEVLNRLDLREQILAKIFYLGGRRQLEEVLSIKIEDVDFKLNCIHFPKEDVLFPKHLLLDIKQYVKNRKQGLIFIGKEGERISHTTPFRSLKTIVSDLKLDPEFTFKSFAHDV